MTTINLATLLDRAIKALPAKSPVRVEIAAALEQRAVYTERAKRAWETMRANKLAASAPAPKPVKGKGKAKPAPVAKPVKAKGKTKPNAQAEAHA
jgi:hypothetical protein